MWVEWNQLLTPKEHEEMRFVAEVTALAAQHRVEDIARQDAFEDRIERRYRTSLTVQFFLALVAAAVALIGARLLPFYAINPQQHVTTTTK